MAGTLGPAQVTDTGRAFHLVNLNLPKSGSTSISQMFPSRRSVHEFDHHRAMEVLLDRLDGAPSGELDRYLLERDARATPEVDSTTFLHLAADSMPTLFPSARFVIALRPGPADTFDRWPASVRPTLADTGHHVLGGTVWAIGASG
ncbi:MAG: hypothetical protein AAGF73_03125 [Actinomycetota bacterium]